MNFKPEVLALLLLAGILTVTPYGIYDGTVKQIPGVQVALQEGPGTRSIAGAAAGGAGGIARVPECRTCMRKG